MKAKIIQGKVTNESSILGITCQLVNNTDLSKEQWLFNVRIKEKDMVILHRCKLIWTCKAHTGAEVLCTSVFSLTFWRRIFFFKS